MGRFVGIALALIALIAAILWALVEWAAPAAYVQDSPARVVEPAPLLSPAPDENALVAPAAASETSSRPPAGAGPATPNDVDGLTTQSVEPAGAPAPQGAEDGSDQASALTEPAAAEGEPKPRSVISQLSEGGERTAAAQTPGPSTSSGATGEAPTTTPGAQSTSASPAPPASPVLQDRFKSRTIAYNRPPGTLGLGQTIDLSLVIDATQSAEASAGLKGFSGEVVQREVALSDTVLAQLSGTGFRIEPISIARQTLSARLANRWQWRVTPTEAGDQVLILELFGYPAGSSDAEPLAAYRDDIRVEIRQIDRLLSWASALQPVFGLIAGLAGLGSAGLAGARFVRRRWPGPGA